MAINLKKIRNLMVSRLVAAFIADRIYFNAGSTNDKRPPSHPQLDAEEGVHRPRKLQSSVKQRWTNPATAAALVSR
jgi:hypothetical protein